MKFEEAREAVTRELFRQDYARAGKENWEREYRYFAGRGSLRLVEMRVEAVELLAVLGIKPPDTEAERQLSIDRLWETVVECAGGKTANRS